MEKIKNIASDRPTYGYGRVWAMLRNSGTRMNQKTVRRVLKDNNLNLPASGTRGEPSKGIRPIQMHRINCGKPITHIFQQNQE
ncbi:MAG: IS3 family transposase [Thermoplasmatales archaeon]